MRYAIPKVLMMLAASAAVSSCGNKEEIHLKFPPVADLKQQPEPAYPIEALHEGEEGAKAEDAWQDRILIWGRTGWAQNRRVCQWAVELGMKVPDGYCSK